MAEEKKNHWNFLSNLLGVPSTGDENQSEPETPRAEETAEKSIAEPPKPGKKERKSPAPLPSGWGELANEFGLEVDEPEPVVEDGPEHETPIAAAESAVEPEKLAADDAPVLEEVFAGDTLPPKLPGFGVTTPLAEEEASTWEPDADMPQHDEDVDPELVVAANENEDAWREEDEDEEILTESFAIDEPEESEKKPPRRRRRRKRRSAEETEDRETKVLTDEDDFRDEDDSEDSRESADDDSDRERRPRRRRRRRSSREEEPASVSDDAVTSTQDSDDDDDDESEEQRPRRRRGRRRRGRAEEKEAAPKSEIEPVGDIDNREDEESDRPRPRQFASWSEAIGHVVEANLASRTKTNGRGGGRGRGGRGRSREQSSRGDRGRRSSGDSR